MGGTFRFELALHGTGTSSFELRLTCTGLDASDVRLPVKGVDEHTGLTGNALKRTMRDAYQELEPAASDRGRAG